MIELWRDNLREPNRLPEKVAGYEGITLHSAIVFLDIQAQLEADRLSWAKTIRVADEQEQDGTITYQRYIAGDKGDIIRLWLVFKAG